MQSALKGREVVTRLKPGGTAILSGGQERDARLGAPRTAVEASLRECLSAPGGTVVPGCSAALQAVTLVIVTSIGYGSLCRICFFFCA